MSGFYSPSKGATHQIKQLLTPGQKEFLRAVARDLGSSGLGSHGRALQDVVRIGMSLPSVCSYERIRDTLRSVTFVVTLTATAVQAGPIWCANIEVYYAPDDAPLDRVARSISMRNTTSMWRSMD